ncbi:helix-turn-helix domain-containing protein [Pseudothauera nasutitermitis]|uniref:Helix-turn-helix domain-containing protein n=1 Tax=Pseudothauera nasutitermitis TaxID=2565930 RepID=A0A4S4ASY6_9RHOO|nr:helix-turn-helix domain-containing protein [Pseudothauera nasutitermitis]THF62993.1 helix-turn-helix domain-containing protein [Pseudothauera nasutitermitis]
MPTEPIAPDLRFLLLPLPEFALLPFGGFLDKLRFTADEEDYSRQRYCAWRILGIEAGSVRASSGVAVHTDLAAADARWDEYDYLVLFGGRSARATEALAPRYRPLLRRALRHGVKLVAIDNASFLLAACGLLDGHKVAVHWRHEAEFRASHPRVEVMSEQLYCVDGARITCAGGMAAIDLAVELLAGACGRTRALKGLPDMLVDEARGSAHALRSLDDAAVSGRHVGRAIALMRTLLGTRATSDELAARIGVSRRQLDRLFLQRHGRTVRAYWTEMRMQHARWRLLNSGHALAQIADEIGLADTSQLARQFRRRFGQSPARFRKQPG